MTGETERDQERRRLIQEICARMPPEISEIVGKTLRSPDSAAAFGASDPEVVKLFSKLRALDDPLERINKQR